MLWHEDALIFFLKKKLHEGQLCSRPWLVSRVHAVSPCYHTPPFHTVSRRFTVFAFHTSTKENANDRFYNGEKKYCSSHDENGDHSSDCAKLLHAVIQKIHSKLSGNLLFCIISYNFQTNSNALSCLILSFSIRCGLIWILNWCFIQFTRLGETFLSIGFRYDAPLIYRKHM